MKPIQNLEIKIQEHKDWTDLFVLRFSFHFSGFERLERIFTKACTLMRLTLYVIISIPDLCILLYVK